MQTNDPKSASMLNLRHVLAFVTLAQELNFGRAAQMLNLSQPPLSRQIRLLEAHLGVPLFERTSRSVQLTPAGQRFLPEARRLLLQSNEAEAVARQAGETIAGEITLGFISASTYSFLPRLLRRAAETLPGVGIELKELDNNGQISELQLGGIDLGLLRPMSPTKGVVFDSVARERLMVALPASHRLTRQRTLSVSDLHGENMIMYHPDAPYMRGLLQNLFATYHAAVETVQEVTHAQAILSLVSAGMGVAIVPGEARNASFDNLIFRPLASDTNVDLWLASRTVSRNNAIAPVRRLALQLNSGVHPSVWL